MRAEIPDGAPYTDTIEGGGERGDDKEARGRPPVRGTARERKRKVQKVVHDCSGERADDGGVGWIGADHRDREHQRGVMHRRAESARGGVTQEGSAQKREERAQLAL